MAKSKTRATVPSSDPGKTTKRHFPRLRVPVLGLAVLVAASIVVRLTAIPILPHLPAPAGPFAVGTVYWDAASMAGSGSAQAARDCRLAVQLWYPAGPTTGQPRAPYSWSARLLSVRRWVRTDAILGAPVAAAQARYPVLLFLPGWSGGRGENTALVQDIASRGFVVAALGYDSPTCALDEGASPGETNATDMDFSSPAAFERTEQIANRKISRVAAAAVRVVDRLAELNQNDSQERFTGRLDLDHIGAIGHSLGGAIAVQICWLDPRVKAAIDIDGWLFNAAAGGWIRQPFLSISDDGPAPTGSDFASANSWDRYSAILSRQTEDRKLAAFAEHGGMMLTIKGSRHEDFADYPYLSRSAVLLGRHPDGSAIRIAADYAAGFFRLALLGQSSSLFKEPPASVRLQIWDPSAAAAAQAK
jgi:predicted dienelactone hydrolase